MAPTAADHVGEQLSKLSQFSQDNIANCGNRQDNFRKWEALFRAGVPDFFKRKALFRYYNFTEEKAEEQF
jgi:hypothetical protein